VTNGTESHADASNGQADAPSIKMDMIRPANETECIRMCQIGSRTPDLPAGSTTSRSDATDSFGMHMDASSIQTDTITPENTPQTISIPRRGLIQSNLPMEAAKPHSEEPNGCRNRTDTLSAWADVHIVGNDTKPTENGAESVRRHQMDSKMQDSPNGREIVTPESIIQWKRVSIGDRDVYVPRNTPIDTTGRNFVFGRVEGGVKAIAPSIESERAGIGNCDEWNGDVDGTTSGGSVDSKRAKTVLLAAGSCV